MSLDKLAEMMKGRTELDEHAKERVVERAREPFHNAWLREVYPFWQGPLKALSRAPGVSRVGHGIDTAPELGVTFGALALALGEDIFAETVVGVVAKISYVFAGDVNDGQLVRLPSITDAGKRANLGELAKVWTGPIDRLIAGAEDDVDEAAELLTTLLVDGVKAHDERVAAEKKAAAEAEAARIAAEEQARKDEEEHQEKMKTAALEASRAAEEEAARDEEAVAKAAANLAAETVPAPPPAPGPDPLRKRRPK